MEEGYVITMLKNKRSWVYEEIKLNPKYIKPSPADEQKIKEKADKKKNATKSPKSLSNKNFMFGRKKFLQPQTNDKDHLSVNYEYRSYDIRRKLSEIKEIELENINDKHTSNKLDQLTNEVNIFFIF